MSGYGVETLTKSFMHNCSTPLMLSCDRLCTSDLLKEGNCKYICILLFCFQDGQSRIVRQFQFTDWPDQGVPSSGEGFIEFIGHVQKTKEQFGQDGPIIVHCRLDSYLPQIIKTFFSFFP